MKVYASAFSVSIRQCCRNIFSSIPLLLLLPIPITHYSVSAYYTHFSLEVTPKN